MKLIYTDESGDTVPLSQGGSEWFVLTACIIDESDRQKVEDSLRQIKWKFYGDRDVEFKSNFIRYANPDVAHGSPLKLNDRGAYNELERTLTEFLQGIPAVLVSVVIDKAYYWGKYPAQNPYDTAYMFLLERLQICLDENKSLGIVIIDPREGRVEKSFIGDRLERVHHSMRFGNMAISREATPNIVERLLYSDSKNTVGIQIADLYCYPVFHIFEYGKKPGAYWRFHDVTLPKLRRAYGTKLFGFGLKIFTDKSKSDLWRQVIF